MFNNIKIHYGLLYRLKGDKTFNFYFSPLVKYSYTRFEDGTFGLNISFWWLTKGFEFGISNV